MQRGEIYLANFPYGDQPVMKLRPVLLLTGRVGNGNEVIVAYISSVIPAPLLSTDILIDPSDAEHRDTRLKTVSVVRLHKIATIHESSIQRYLGFISPET
ncbi:MAG: type II toxin-antitoxin system PemK/MazF family toxin, partial [Fimbriimonadales bacterium]|nr:type II toxin-antitoxin system PemK/MazF family toxin [Fimbriimonadales bacterium]